MLTIMITVCVRVKFVDNLLSFLGQNDERTIRDDQETEMSKKDNQNHYAEKTFEFDYKYFETKIRQNV